MKKPLQRLVIYTKDIEKITGLKAQASRKLMESIRQSLGKKKRQFITVSEFCAATGLPEEKVLPFLEL